MTVWRRSSRCESSACVFVATFGDTVGVRDGKDPDGPHLTFTREAWTEFLVAVKAGDLDG